MVRKRDSKDQTMMWRWLTGKLGLEGGSRPAGQGGIRWRRAAARVTVKVKTEVRLGWSVRGKQPTATKTVRDQRHDGQQRKHQPRGRRTPLQSPEESEIPHRSTLFPPAPEGFISHTQRCHFRREGRAPEGVFLRCSPFFCKEAVNIIESYLD